MSDVIRQLVMVIRLPGEVCGQKLTGLGDPVNDSLDKLGIAEVTGHGACQLLPESVPALQIGTSTRELVACAHGKFHDIRVGDVDLSEQLAGREIDIRAV